jgi:transcriptional regulator with XRE-family HTH domain
MSESPAGGVTVPQWTIGDRMRKARENAGLKQADLAAEIGIGRTSAVNYESGHSVPSRPVLLAWALRTRVPLEWLCGDDGPRARRGVTVKHMTMRCSWTSGHSWPRAHLAAA